jgi:hypothetical protein
MHPSPIRPTGLPAKIRCSITTLQKTKVFKGVGGFLQKSPHENLAPFW